MGYMQKSPNFCTVPLRFDRKDAVIASTVAPFGASVGHHGLQVVH
jgi:hypothetical protein